MISAFRFYTFFLLIGLTLFAVMKPVNLLPDMEIYKDYFEAIKSGYVVLVEYSYVLTSRFVLSFSDSFRWVILLYVFTSLYIKFNCFQKFNAKYSILLMYLSSLLILHEFIQIRVALSLSFLLLAVTLHSKIKVYQWFIFILACFVHVSAILFVAFYCASFFFKKLRYLSLIYFALIYFVLLRVSDMLNFINSFSSNYVLNKIEIYVNAASSAEESVNIFSVRLIVLYVVIFLFVYRQKKLSDFDYVLYFCATSLAIVAIGLKSFPDISFRLFDISIFFSIFLVASIKSYYRKHVFYIILPVFIVSAIYYNFRLIGYVYS